MEDKILVYVAGNPNLYPLEYFEPSTRSFQGVIPRLLAEFSAESKYELVYYASGESDQRERLAGNMQVDLVSGYRDGDPLPANTRSLPLFTVEYQGEDLSYLLCATAAAPKGLEEDLSAFLSSMSQQAVTGLLVETAESSSQPYSASLPLLAGGLAVVSALLLAVLAGVIRHYRKKLQRTRQQLEQDPVTGLGKLDYLQRYYRQLVNDENRVLYSLVYFILDTEYLYRMAGSQEADNVMRYCATVLQEYTAETDVLARVSRDGFALLKLSGDPKQLCALTEPVLKKLRDYPRIHSAPFDIRTAIGIYPLKLGARDLSEMVFNAGQEAHRALIRQEDCSVFSAETIKQMQMEQKLRSTVEQALDGHEFRLFIQFYADAASLEIVGGEALSRWMHPEQGLLSPSVFVPILEREGLTYRLDYHCLRCSCEFLQRLADRGIDDFFLSCNFSRETFSSPDFAQRCMEIMDGFSFPKELLILELTESILVKDLSPIRANMLALKEYGLRIALDDFGEGFTSFSDLQECPVDGIKLDKRLVDNVSTRIGSSILRAMIQIGHELGLTILAEGVETPAQAQALKELSCDVIQGFHFSPPLPLAEAEKKILEGRAALSLP